MEDYIINLTDETVDDLTIDDIDNVCKITFNKLDVCNPILNILIVDNNKIQEINREYRGKDNVTDVISFAFEDYKDIEYDNFRFLGEIYISLQKARKQAEEYGHSERREICYLTVHGLLHLLGYDHMNEEDKKVMRSLEEEILNEYDVKR
ncbi:MAG: rRNA maturation RNase YbeY [Bacilli bacterium]|nr:rRNA maturation RNase YbeY [Bacilli bacterium]